VTLLHPRLPRRGDEKLEGAAKPVQDVGVPDRQHRPALRQVALERRVAGQQHERRAANLLHRRHSRRGRDTAIDDLPIIDGDSAGVDHWKEGKAPGFQVKRAALVSTRW
jgi:hypothetical protein